MQIRIDLPPALMRMIYTHHPHVSIPLKVSRYRWTPTMHAYSAAFWLRHVRRPWELYAGISNSGGNRVFKQRAFFVRQKAAVRAVLPTGGPRNPTKISRDFDTVTSTPPRAVSRCEGTNREPTD